MLTFKVARSLMTEQPPWKTSTWPSTLMSYVAMATVAAICIIIALALLAFNIRFRRAKVNVYVFRPYIAIHIYHIIFIPLCHIEQAEIWKRQRKERKLNSTYW